MEIITGKQSQRLDETALTAWLERYHDVTVDLGTGDGRFVRELARRDPGRGVIGIDTCAANLIATSRRAPANAMYAIADAASLSPALAGRATRLTINFPWGSLLRMLLAGEPRLLAGLRRVGRAGGTIELRLNGEALGTTTVSEGIERLSRSLGQIGARVDAATLLGPAELRALPSTWAKRLAFGRQPGAIELRAVLT